MLPANTVPDTTYMNGEKLSVNLSETLIPPAPAAEARKDQQ
jgi:hypothetical protein